MGEDAIRGNGAATAEVSGKRELPITARIAAMGKSKAIRWHQDGGTDRGAPYAKVRAPKRWSSYCPRDAYGRRLPWFQLDRREG
jgi:hypothetical protein